MNAQANYPATTPAGAQGVRTSEPAMNPPQVRRTKRASEKKPKKRDLTSHTVFKGGVLQITCMYCDWSRSNPNKDCWACVEAVGEVLKEANRRKDMAFNTANWKAKKLQNG